jgi:hypothetical protein
MFDPMMMQQSSQSSSSGPAFDPANPLELETPMNTAGNPVLEQYKPMMEMQNLFAQTARNPPNRADYQPDTMRRITAALAGFAGSGPTGMWGGVPVGFRANPNQYEDTRRILDEPYNQAALDYKLRIDPLRSAADDERMANQVNRQYTDSLRYRDYQDKQLARMTDRDAEIARANLEREDVARKKLEISQKANEIREFVAKRPNLKPAIDENGNLFLYDSTNPNADTVRTGIKTGDLSDMQKNELGITRDAARINAQGRVDLVNINARTQGAITVKETVPGKNTAAVNRPPGTGTPRTITSVAKGLLIQQAIANDPSIAPFIAKNAAGMPTGGLIEPKWYQDKNDPAYERARKAIAAIPTTLGGNTAATQAPTGATRGSDDKGEYFLMKDKNGDMKKVRPENVDAFKRANGLQ